MRVHVRWSEEIVKSFTFDVDEDSYPDFDPDDGAEGLPVDDSDLADVGVADAETYEVVDRIIYEWSVVL